MSFEKSFIFIVMVFVSYFAGFSNTPQKVEVNKEISIPKEIEKSKKEFQSEKYVLQWPSYEKKCLALNIYWEARNQSIEGMVAVGNVTMNRVISSRFPNTICEVVKEPKQFSWYSDGKPDTPKEIHAWMVSNKIANYVINTFKTKDITNGSLHYHANYVNPWWSKHHVRITKIGSHIFYD